MKGNSTAFPLYVFYFRISAFHLVILFFATRPQALKRVFEPVATEIFSLLKNYFLLAP
jgi:hypothetical protein